MSEHEYANPKVLVSTEWVAERIDDPEVRLIEVDVDTFAYEEGHIPGAIAFNWTTELQDQVRRDIAGKGQMEGLLSRAGVSNDSTVVVYGDNNNWFAAYFYWLMKIYGHEDVRLMNGGRKKWLEEGRPLTTVVPVPEPTSYRAKDPDISIRAYLTDVLEHSRSGGKLVDVRSPQEFTGEVIAPPGMTETAQRGGHIPGARNIPWASTVNEDGTFKPAGELRALYASEGITADTRESVIAYCRIGERSSHTWFVLKELLGFENVKNYDGSWTEYGSVVGAPIER